MVDWEAGKLVVGEKGVAENGGLRIWGATSELPEQCRLCHEALRCLNLKSNTPNLPTY
jgi:hypothetical protein